jgi:hypothetical protein
MLRNFSTNVELHVVIQPRISASTSSLSLCEVGLLIYIYDVSGNFFIILRYRCTLLAG